MCNGESMLSSHRVKMHLLYDIFISILANHSASFLSHGQIFPHVIEHTWITCSHGLVQDELWNKLIDRRKISMCLTLPLWTSSYDVLIVTVVSSNINEEHSLAALHYPMNKARELRARISTTFEYKEHIHIVVLSATLFLCIIWWRNMAHISLQTFTFSKFTIWRNELNLFIRGKALDRID